MSAVYRPMSIARDFRTAPLALALAISILFKPHHSKFGGGGAEVFMKKVILYTLF